MASSSTTNHKARQGDTIEKIATVIGVTPDEIIALNPDLKTNSTMVPDQTYKLPATAAAASAVSVSDILREYYARNLEADKSKDGNDG